MNIELRKISHSPSLSEETNAFTADLYVDGKKIGYVKNQGCGGSTDIHAYDKEDWETIKKAEAYCATLPKKVYDFGSFDVNLESYVDDLFEKWLMLKDIKKHEKKGIVYKSPEGFNTKFWKCHTLKSIMNVPNGKQTVQTAIDKLKKEGKEILNTNLAEFGLTA